MRPPEFLSNKLPHYLALMRFDRPIGWMLLMWPTMMACWLAADGQPDGQLVWVFALGVIVMRSAGCVINDYADRDIDPQVARTHTRPLAAGAISGAQALGLFAFLGLVAIGLLLLLPRAVWLWAVPAALVTIIYPYMKRFIQAPQMVLGIAFSFGIPMVYVAFGHAFDTVFSLLVLANFLWVIAYDTCYAMSDREDDLKIGVKSSAILFGEYDRLIVGLLQVACLTMWSTIGWLEQLSIAFYVGLILAAALFLYQQWLIRARQRAGCFQAFINNGWVGGFVWFGLIISF